MSHWVVNVFWQAGSLIWAVLRQMLPPASSQTTHTVKTFGIHLILHFVQLRSEFSLGPSHDLYTLALVQMLTLKHSLAGFSGKHWNPCMLKQKWADSGKEIFSWPPAFMEQKPAETLNLPLLQILTQRLISPLIAHGNIRFRCNIQISCRWVSQWHF